MWKTGFTLSDIKTISYLPYVTIQGTRGDPLITGGHIIKTISYLPYVTIKGTRGDFLIIGGHFLKIISYLPYVTIKGTRGDFLITGGHFLKTVSYLPYVNEPVTKYTCNVGTLSLGYWGVPWRQVSHYKTNGSPLWWPSCTRHRAG